MLYKSGWYNEKVKWNHPKKIDTLHETIDAVLPLCYGLSPSVCSPETNEPNVVESASHAR